MSLVITSLVICRSERLLILKMRRVQRIKDGWKMLDKAINHVNWPDHMFILQTAQNKCLPSSHSTFPDGAWSSSHLHFTNSFFIGIAVPRVWPQIGSYLSAVYTFDVASDSWNAYHFKNEWFDLKWVCHVFIYGSPYTDGWIEMICKTMSLVQVHEYLQTINDRNFKPYEKNFCNVRFHPRTMFRSPSLPNEKSLSMHGDDLIFTRHMQNLYG